MRKLALVTLAALLVIPGLGCRRPTEYEATVEITRSTVAAADEAGNPILLDAEVSYVDCPGTQMEVIRGDKEFAECAAKLKVGDKVKAKLTHAWDPEGFWDYDVHELGGCKRAPDPHDDASYKVTRDCADWSVNGTSVGFQCKYSDKVDLNRSCPWFQKR